MHWRKTVGYLLLLGCLCSCRAPGRITAAGSQLDTLELWDSIRNRKVPVAIYKPASGKATRSRQLVILSHGYGENKGGDYLAYSYIAECLAENGYEVVSIQHELPTDSLIPLTGDPRVVRRPFWDRGADNIMFVIGELRKQNMVGNQRRICLVGHSNGGDMTALFPQKYPGVADRVITLDNRRMPLPRGKFPKVYSLRSSDQPADERVLPSDVEARKFKMTIVHLKSTTHNEMDDHASEKQRKEIQGYILRFLEDR